MSREVDIPSHVAMASLPLPAASELVVCPCGVSFLLRRWCALSHPRLHLQPCNPATLAFSHAAHRPAPCTPFPIPDPVLLHIGTMQYPVFPCCHARSVHIRPFVRSFPRLAPPPPPPLARCLVFPDSAPRPLPPPCPLGSRCRSWQTTWTWLGVFIRVSRIEISLASVTLAQVVRAPVFARPLRK